MSTKDIARFGVGYQTDSELHGTFVLSDEHVRFDKNGAGGAVPVQGYRGVWPLFDKPSERLGGADVIEVHDDDTASNGGSSSGGKAMQKDGVSSSSTSYARRPKWMCRPKTTCSPCTKAERHRPYCQPYGNRILIECRRIEVTKTPERKPLPVGATNKNGKAPPLAVPENQNADAKARETKDVSDRIKPQSLQLGDVVLEERSDRQGDETQLWARQELFVSGHVYKGYQICGRDRSKEAFDYAEFVAVNLILALVGIFFLLKRQRVLAGQHQSMLARRIGRT